MTRQQNKKATTKKKERVDRVYQRGGLQGAVEMNINIKHHLL